MDNNWQVQDNILIRDTLGNLSYYTSDNPPQQHILGTPLTSKISNTSDERTRLMGNIINDVGGTTDWSGLTEIKFDSGYEIKCSAIDSASNLLDIFSSNPSTVNMTDTGRGINRVDNFNEPFVQITYLDHNIYTIIQLNFIIQPIQPQMMD